MTALGYAGSLRTRSVEEIEMTMGILPEVATRRSA
jgi:hypothetical protein